MKVAQDLNRTLDVWSKISQEETDSLVKQCLLLSSGKYVKSSSPYSISAITATTKCTDNNLITPTSNQEFRHFQHGAFPLRSASPEKTGKTLGLSTDKMLSNSEIETKKHEDVLIE